MYRVFFYGVECDSKSVFIEDEKEFETFEEALRFVVFFEEGDLFEIARDVFDNGVTMLKTVARPASMRSFVNSYCFRW